MSVNRLIQTAKFAQSCGINDIYFTTNGSLLTPEVSERIISLDLFSRIQVSLDATTSDVYNQIRRGGSYELVLDNINSFLKAREVAKKRFPKIRVSFLVLPENRHQSTEFVSYWSDRVDAVALQSSVLKPNTERNDQSDFLKPRSTFCPNPFRQLIVRANGDILPCCSFWGDKLKLSHLNKDADLINVFTSKSMKKLQTSFTDDSIDLFKACQNCLSSCNPDLD